MVQSNFDRSGKMGTWNLVKFAQSMEFSRPEY